MNSSGIPAHHDRQTDGKKRLSTAHEKIVAVVVPVHKRELNDNEIISLNHLKTFLWRYDKYLVAPNGLNVPWEGFAVKKFSKKYFRAVHTYSKLLVSKNFYQAFRRYKYILIYQLDCLVFSDQLLEWCEKGYDYVGAPWLKLPDVPWVTEDSVGNGGFSLRKVQSHLKVLNAYQNPMVSLKQGAMYLYRLLKTSNLFWRSKKTLKIMMRNRNSDALMKVSRVVRQVARSIDLDYRNEDIFWAFEAKKWYPAFTIPSVEIALQFSFESNPRLCFERSNHHLPFGCHAWWKYDQSFWEPYLLKSPDSFSRVSAAFLDGPGRGEGPMKVAFIMPTYFAIDSVIAGGERYAYELAKAVSKRAETTIFTFGSQNRTVRDGSLSIVYCKTAFYVGSMTNPVAANYIQALRRFDVIHCMQFKTLVTELATLFGALYRKKTFITDLAGGTCYSLSRFIPVEKWVREFLFLSEYNRNLNVAIRRPYKIIYCGVDTDFFSPKNQTKREGFLYIGRIFSLKGIHDLIEALPSESTLEIIGQCHEPEYLEKLKKMSEGKRVSFYHELTDTEVLEKIRKSLAVVLPSYTDAGITTALEAMACETPVVGTRIGSFPEFVKDDITGFLVPCGAPKILGSVLDKIQKNPDMLIPMRTVAREHVVKNFTWDKVAERCLEAYMA